MLCITFPFRIRGADHYCITDDVRTIHRNNEMHTAVFLAVPMRSRIQRTAL